MAFELIRTGAGRRSAASRLRGGAAGSISAAISLAAHGWVSGGMLPSTTTLALLATVAVLIAALTADVVPLRDTSSGLIAALAAGQVLGHFTMGFGSGHLQHGDVQLSPTMLVAHLLAAVAASIVIRGAEAAYRIGTAVLARILPMRPALPTAPDRAHCTTSHRDRIVLRVLVSTSLRTRAPPIPAVC